MHFSSCSFWGVAHSITRLPFVVVNIVIVSACVLKIWYTIPRAPSTHLRFGSVGLGARVPCSGLVTPNLRRYDDTGPTGPTCCSFGCLWCCRTALYKHYAQADASWRIAAGMAISWGMKPMWNNGAFPNRTVEQCCMIAVSHAL